MLHLHGFAWLAGNFGAATLYRRLKSDSGFKNRIISYISSIVRETVDISLGQKFQSETPGATLFPIPQDMTPAEFHAALDIDSNNVAARVQMHTHSKTCTKYQNRYPRSNARTRSVPVVQIEGMATDADNAPQQSDTRKQPVLQMCRFLFPKPLIPE
jgi:hypothetical protein